LGRTCDRPCEPACRRARVEENNGEHPEPVAICRLKRVAADYKDDVKARMPSVAPPNGWRVACVGAGPSSLTVARDLAPLGYDVTVFDGEAKPGGFIRSQIPRFRLPESVIDEETGYILDLGVTFISGQRVESMRGLLAQGYDAVFVGCGAPRGRELDLPGRKEAAAHIHLGIDWLASVSFGHITCVAPRVIVLGGGNTAIDTARSLRRFGANVTILYRRTLQDMPAHETEIAEAREEGIAIQMLCSPVGIKRNKNSLSVTCIKMKPGDKDASGRARPVPIAGSEFTVEADAVISAIGQIIAAEGFEGLVNGRGIIEADGNSATGMKGFFAGGDAVLGPATVTAAIGAGRRAAAAIGAYIQGGQFKDNGKLEISYKGMPLNDYDKIPRNRGSLLPVAERLRNIETEVHLPIEADQVLAEARRCIRCGSLKSSFVGMPYFGKICLACRNCEVVCPNQALRFPHFYTVEKGRWHYEFDYPKKAGGGYPNPLRAAEAPEFNAIASQLTETEKVIY
ncbi:MAG: hypothetical protein CVU24_17440, partial [Betaproteobacteria bacterium HGW-Betaproteobacteria-18]